MTQLYSVVKHNRFKEKIIVLLSALSLAVVTFALLYSYQTVSNSNERWQEHNRHLAQQQTLVSEIRAVLNRSITLNNNLPLSQRKVLKEQISLALHSIKNVQLTTPLTVTQGKALIKVTLAVETLQARLHRPASEGLILTRENIAFVQSHGLDQLDTLHHNLHVQSQTQAAQLKQEFDTMMFYLLIACLAIAPLVFLIVRYSALLARYNNTVNYLPRAQYDMEAIFANLPEAAFVLDAAGNIVYANHQACIFSNYNELQIQPMHIGQLISESDGLFKEKIKESAEQGIHQIIVDFLPNNKPPIPTQLKITVHNVNDKPLTFVTLTSIATQQENLEYFISNEKMFQQSESIVNQGSWRWDLQKDTIYWSPQIYTIYGYQPHELEIDNESILSLIPTKEREEVSNALNEAILFDKPYDVTHHIIHKDGHNVLIRQQAHTLRDDNNKAIMMFGIISPVIMPDPVNAPYHQVFTHSKDAMLITDANGNIEQVNSAFEQLTGYNKDQVVGEQLSQVSRGAYFDETIYSKIWQQLTENKQWQGELWQTSATGIVYPTYQYFTQLALTDTDEIKYLCSFTDISEQKHVNELLSNHSIEQQTKLPSRNVLFDRITQAIKRHERDNKSTVVILLSLAFATTPNKALLTAVSTRLKDITRSHDSIARFGLNEFIVVLEGISNPEDAYIVSDKIAKSFALPFEVGDNQYHISCNVGIAMHPLHSANDVLLLNYADAAMQYAKSNDDSNIQVFNEKILKDYNETLHLNNQLQRAIDLKELSVQFQPIMDLTSQSLAIAVAHIRWHHAAYNNTQTYQFIDAAKNGKLREPLHFWLLKNALEQATQWPNHDLHGVKLQIKVVREQLVKPGLAVTVKTLLNLYHYSPQRLILELESQALSAFDDVAIAEIEILKALGVTFNVSILSEKQSIPTDELNKLNIDNLTSVKRSLTAPLQGSEYRSRSEKIIEMLDSNNIYSARQDWIKNACTVNIDELASAAHQTYLVCDSVPNQNLIVLAQLLEAKSTASQPDS